MFSCNLKAPPMNKMFLVLQPLINNINKKLFLLLKINITLHMKIYQQIYNLFLEISTINRYQLIYNKKLQLNFWEKISLENNQTVVDVDYIFVEIIKFTRFKCQLFN